jgi:DNA repair exonuclease SbcCD ATPase subunit
MPNLKIQNIEIKNTTLPLRTAVEFKRLVSEYLDLINQDSEEIMTLANSNPQAQLGMRKQKLDSKFKDIQKITDTKLRERRMAELQPQLDEIEKEIDELDSKIMTNAEFRSELLSKTSAFEKESNSLMNKNQSKYIDKEIEILQAILPKVVTIPDDFDYDNCSLSEPRKIIQEFLANVENDCNAFFTKWSQLTKTQVQG